MHLASMHSTQLEGLAVTTHEELRIALPVDAFQLADALDLFLTPVSRFEEGFEGKEIRYNGRAPHRDQQAYVALCTARYLLQRAGFFPDAMTILQFARALVLPLERFRGDLRKRCSLASLRREHPHVPTQWICARIGDVYNQRADAPSPNVNSLQELGAASRLLALAAR